MLVILNLIVINKFINININNYYLFEDVLCKYYTLSIVVIFKLPTKIICNLIA